MNVITINDAAQLTNQLVDGFERNNTKSSVEGTVILNRDNGFFPTALKLRIEPDKDDSERITLSFLYLALMGTEIPGYQFAWQTTTIAELKDLCSNAQELESWLTKPLSKDNQEVPFGFNEERLSISQEIERPSDEEITNYLNEFFEGIRNMNDSADSQLSEEELEELVNDIQAIDVEEDNADDSEQNKEDEVKYQNTTSTAQQISTQQSEGGFGGLILAAGLAGMVFSAGVAVGITLPFIGAAKLCRRMFK